MSGPKVVRVKTREERIAEAEVWITRVRVAAARWERRVRASELAGEPEIVATQGRADALAGLLSEDRFDEVERQSRQEIAFLDQDLARRGERAAEDRARRRARGRRQASAAASVLESLAVAGKVVPEPILVQLEAARSGRAGDPAAVDAAIAEAVELLATDGGAESGVDRRSELAARLGLGETTRTLARWLDEHPAADEAVASAVDRALSLVEIEAGAELVAPFVERAGKIAAEASDRRRRLLFDSLRLDLAALLRDSRALADTRQRLESLAAELAMVPGNVEATALVTEISTGIEAESDLALLTGLHGRAAAWLERYRAARAADARRDAVLTGLAAIGYEVREGMATLWSDGGRLVLRRGSRDDIGVELAGNPAAGRLQVRAVGIEGDAGRWDHTRDADIERLFCGDLDVLRGRLDAAGIELSIERATPVGARPLRTVAIEAEVGERAEVVDQRLDRRSP